ncbi:hypothetical protein AURANDRAFT_53365 [Aureococcus anophagefferens]|uniref:Actin n=1 Tax=Aureococcus anophagefferens TaxID=44056 RepID=F0Y706_AURAN|nr:hypothetical protein AURANDRAFT_53365 [Aureococcus anophagefferens]EGB08886.1 hypothetical protein AURANDRAFT_53365 [Aureococcus anophagefferens]|mmetsp:Transcript_28671/g.97678  ORF Transcript_28671/g.97678 Transcript_28671/m.97678 type:complete len:425 (-) Transcript_28671:291-1565(-)|eukprot:XP_009036023.1 hypothetical protein AURANDRAFT_53365 [Aureococcus anophagefferens]
MDALPCVLDNGSYEVRVGFCGDTSPRFVAPNCTARPRQQLRVLVADEIHSIKNLAQLEVTRPLEHGILVNAGCQKDIWERCFDEVGCETRESKVMVTESVLAPPSVQQTTDEVLFEDFEFLGRCRMAAPLCVAAAVAQLDRGNRTPGEGILPRNIEEASLVVDCGLTATTITPVVAGSPIRSGIRRIDIGGQLLTGYLRDLVSYRQYNMSNECVILDKLKKHLCFVSQEPKEDLTACDGTTHERGAAGPHYAEYVLPDFKSIDQGYARLAHSAVSMESHEEGVKFDYRRRRTPTDAMPQFLRLESERFYVPELLFSPQDISLRQCGVHEIIADAIINVNPRLRAPLSRHIVLCGGGSRLAGLCDRLKREVDPLLPHSISVIHPSEPSLLAFQGAAILAAIPENYLSRQDWQEHGPHCFPFYPER